MVDQVFDQESETEEEDDDATCQAVKVGIMVGGEMRPVAPDGCQAYLYASMKYKMDCPNCR